MVRRWPAWVVDLGVVVLVAVPTVMDAWWNEAGTRQADGWTYAWTVVSLLSLVPRRRWPVVAALGAGAGFTGLYVLGHHGELLNLPAMVALYSVAVRRGRRATVVAGVVGAVWSGLLGFTSDDPIGARGGSPVLEVLVPLVPLALGDAVRSRREVVDLAAAAERAEIAREFHDVVAHTMAAVNVQMAAAVAAFDTSPDVARAALLDARESSRAAMRELRATVAVLREPGERRPAPRLAEVGALVEPARAAGISVSVDDRSGEVDLSGAAELAAYRVVQEALTNVVRHSRASAVSVALRPTAGGGLEVEVVDDGRGGAVDVGHGLRGMAERVEAVGGTVDVGPAADGRGWRVRAVVPP